MNNRSELLPVTKLGVEIFNANVMFSFFQDYDKFLKFYRKADKLAKQRAKMIKAREEALAKLKAKQAKKK